MHSEQNFLSPSEVLHRLGISYVTLLRKVRDAEIPHVKLGNKLLFPQSYFDNLEKLAYEALKGGSQ